MTMTTIHTTEASAKAAVLTLTTAQRMLTARFRNPARMAAVAIPADAWATMESSLPTDSPYKMLLSAVLESAAKSILTKRIGEMSLFPSEIDDAIFSADAILAEAAGNNTDWMSKEELTAAWEASATRKAFITNANYVSNAGYRKAVDAFRDLIIKLSGKTTQYTESELDKMVAKLDASDIDTELGAFVLRRVEQIRNKPAKAAFDLDLL